MDQQIIVGGVKYKIGGLEMAHRPGSLEAHREFVQRLAIHDLRRLDECHTAIFALIEAATSVEQVKAIGKAVIKAVLVSNPRVYRQLPNGNWALRNPRKGRVIPFPPDAG